MVYAVTMLQMMIMFIVILNYWLKIEHIKYRCHVYLSRQNGRELL